MATAATSRFLHSTTALFLLRRRRTTTATTSFLRSSLSSTISSSSSNAHRLCSTSTAVATAVATAGLDRHPWSEWEGFVEKLKEKGYFDKTGGVMGEEGGGGDARELRLTSPSYYTRVKVACLTFSRERPDLLRSLPKEDIRAVVEIGCPNLLRKTVNSAKRLREYLKIDEGDVCSACNLRGTCDRAYIMANKDEGARTVDIVRILLQYSTVPLNADLGEKLPVRECVEESVRRLLLKLIKLSDSIPNPELLKVMVKPHLKSEIRHDTKQHHSTEMKKGDWICTECNYLNYARNVKCLRCKENGPKRVGIDGSKMSPRESFRWDNFEMKTGDWICTRCEFMNFARNTECRQCRESRPKKTLQFGEWECPKCNFLNFRRNKTCMKCSIDRPVDESVEDDDGIWRKPRISNEARQFL